MSRHIADLRRTATQSRRIPVAAASLLLAFLAVTTYFASAHPITVDGVAADWMTREPIADNSAIVARNSSDHGEYVWRDQAGDERKVLNGGAADPRVDITHVRYTATSTTLNVLVKVASLPTTSGADTTQVQVAIDKDRVASSGEPAFVGGAETSVSPDAEWEYLAQTRFGSGAGPVAVWEAGVGAPTFIGAESNAADGTIEFAIPWAALDLANPPTTPLRFTTATFRSTATDLPQDVVGGPDALDAVTDYGDPGTSGATDAEFSANDAIDYYADVWFTAAGEVEAPVVVERIETNHPTPNAEWVKLANATGVQLSLAHVKVGDEETPVGGTEGMAAFPAGAMLPVGGKVVVARSGSAYQTAHGSLPDFELEDTSAASNMNTFGLWSSGTTDYDDVGDEVVVLYESSTTADVFTYGAGAYAGVLPLLPPPGAGEIFERSSALRDTDDNDADFGSLGTGCSGTIVFDGGSTGTGTSWHAAANWRDTTTNADRLPTTTDHVCIPDLGIAAVTFNSGTTSVQSVTSRETLNVSAGTLNLTNPAQPSDFATFNFTGGTIGGAGDLTVNGPTTWTNGEFFAPSTAADTVFNAPVALNDGDHQVRFRRLTFDADTTWTNGRILVGEGSSLTNAAGRTFAIQTDDDFQYWTGNAVSFVNQGSVTKQIDGDASNDTTTETVSGNFAFHNTGSVTITSGTLELSGGGTSTGSFAVPSGSTLRFAGGTHNLNAGAAIAGAGTFRIAGGTNNINAGVTYTHSGPLNVSSGSANFAVPLNNNALTVSNGTLSLAANSVVPSLSFSNGTITGAGDLTVNGPTTWTNGEFFAPSTSPRAIFNGPVALSGDDHQVRFRQLELNADTTWTNGRILVGDAASITNGAGRTFAIQTDDDFQYWTGSAVSFVNQGSLTKQIDADTGNDTTTETVSGSFAFHNAGSVAITSGTLELSGGGTSTGSFSVASGSTLRFAGGTHNLNSGASFAGSGTYSVTGGTVNVNTTVTPERVSVSGGTLAGSANLTIPNLTWTGGTISGPSVATTTTVTESLQLSGGSKTLTRRTFNNAVPTSSPTNWTSGNLDLNTGAIFNNAGHVNIAGDQDVTGDASHTWNNLAGATLAKTVGAVSGENTYIQTTFNNDGTLAASAGHLRLMTNGIHSGPFNVATSAVLEIEGGTQTYGGPVTGGPPLATPSGVTANAFATGGALQPGTYFYKVTARNINGETIGSAEVSATISSGAGRVELAWTPVPNASSYRVYRGTSSNGQNVFYTASSASFIDTGSPATGGAVPTRNNSGARVYFSGGTITLNGSYDVPITWVGGGNNTFLSTTTLGELHVFGGTGTFNTPTTPSLVSLSNGTFGGSGNVVATEFSWTGGTHSAPNVATTTTVTDRLALAGSSKALTRRTFKNDVPTSSPTNWTGGNLDLNTGAIFNNGGHINIVGDHDWTGDAGQTVNNLAGATIAKTAGAVSGEDTYLQNTLNNDGTVSATVGHLRLLTNGTHSGPFNVGTSAVLQVEGGTQTYGGPITGGPALATPSGVTATAFATGGGMQPGTYFYKVTARNINGETIGSEEVSATISTVSGRVDLAWTPVANAASYRVYRGTSSNGQNVFYTANSASFTDTGSPATGGAVPTRNNSGARVYFSGGTSTLNGSYNVPITWMGGGNHTLNGATTLGDLHVFGATANFNAGTSPNLFALSSGTANINAASSAGIYSQSGGTLGGTALLTLAGPTPATWTGGTMIGSGTTRVPAGMTLNIAGTGDKTLRERTLDNQGTTAWTGTGDIHSGEGATLLNAGLFDAQNNQTFHHNWGGFFLLHNTGTVRKSAGTGTTQFNVPVENDGILQAQTGTLALHGGDGAGSSAGSYAVPATLLFGGGTHDLAPASSISGAGTVRFANTTVFAGGSYDVGTTSVEGGSNAQFDAAGQTTDVLSHSGGNLGGLGVLTITGPGASSWTGGSSLNAGTTRVAEGATLNLSGTSNKTLRAGRTLDNRGTLVWSGTGEMESGEGATIANGGLFDIQNNQVFHHNWGGGFLLHNTGTLRKSVGTGTTQFNVPVENDGILQAQTGTLALQGGDGAGSSTGSFQVPSILAFTGGTHDLAAGSSVSGAGTVRFSNATVFVGGAYDATTTSVESGSNAQFDAAGQATDVLNHSGGNLGGLGVITITGPGVSTWSGGASLNAGTTRVAEGVTLNLSGTSNKTLRASRTLDNRGTIVWSGTGEFESGDGSVLANAGLFDIQNNQTFHHNWGGTSQLNNTGTVRKSVGTGTTALNLTVDNTGGTINAATGSLNLNGGFANYNATTDVLTGGTYVVQSTLRFHSADVVTNNATVVLDGVASRIADMGSGVGLDGLRNLATNGPAGDLTIKNGRNLFSSPTGSRALANAGHLRGTGTVFANVTSSGTVHPGASPGILTVDGNYTQTASGRLEIEVAKLSGAVAGTDYDRLVVNGTATLAGALDGVALSGLTPATNSPIDVVTGPGGASLATRNGTLATGTTTPRPLSPNLVFQPRHPGSPLVVRLFMVPEANVADVNVTTGDITDAGATINVTLTAPSAETITVDYATSNGTALAASDYTATSGTATFVPGDTSESFVVPILPDGLDEEDETFLVSLSNPINAELGDAQATVTITDDDLPPTLSVANVSVDEGDLPGTTAATFTLQLNGPSAKTIAVTASTADGTATAPADYVAKSQLFTFAPGDTSKTFSVDVVREDLNESDETFTVGLTTTTPLNVQLPAGPAIGTIVDDDTLTWSVNDRTVNEGGDAVFTVTLNRLSDSQQSVNFATGGGTATGGTDYTTTTGTLAIPAGSLTGTITVPTTEDAADEVDETFTLTLSGQTEGNLLDGVGVGTIDDDDGPTASISGPATVGETGTAQYTVTLSAASPQETRVSVATQNGSATGGADYAIAGTELVFTAGQTERSFSVDITSDTVDEANESFHVDVSSPVDASLGTARATTAIDDDDGPVASVVNKTVAEGDAGSTNAVVSISLAAPSPEPVSVAWTTANGTATAGEDYTTSGGTLTIPANTAAGTITVPITGDIEDEADETVLIQLSNPVDLGGTENGQILIDDDDGVGGGGAGSQITVDDVSVTEGDAGTTNAVFTVTMTPAAATPASVTYSTTGITATEGADYGAATNTLLFGAGDSSKTVTIAVSGDRLDEAAETFALNLSSPSGASLSDAQGIGTITDDDDAPVATGQSQTTNEDTAKAITLGATDGDGDTLTYAVVAAPSHGTLTGTGADRTYTPDEHFHGSDSFTFKANDGANDSNVATVSLTVNPVNDAPSAVDDLASVSEDGVIEITPLVNDFDVDGNDLHIDSVQDPANGQATITGEGSTGIQYRPDANYTGFDTFEYTIEDTTGAQATGSITILVTAVNDAPVADDAATTATEDTAKTITLSSTDVEGSTRTYSIVSGPAHGTLSAITGNQVTYTPAGNYNGPDSFRFKANDGALDSAPATISITVTPVNDAPAAADLTRSLAEDTAETITLAATDVDGQPVTYTIVTLPSLGTAAIDGNQVTYTPAANASGTDSFTYRASDGTLTDDGTVSLTITPVNDAPTAAADSATLAEDGTALVDVRANDTDVEGNALTVTAVSSPLHGAASVEGGQVRYTPAANYNGPDGVSYTISDGAGGTATGVLSLTVTAANDAPAAAPVSVTTAEDTATGVTLAGTDVDGDSLTYEVTAAPTKGSLSGGTGAGRTYAPNANVNGPDELTYRVSDGTLSATATVSITITPVNDAPVAAPDSFTVAEDSGATVLAVLANDADVDGDTLTVTAVGPALHGTTGLAPVTYAPGANYNGPDTFTYTASDGNGGSVTGRVNVTVNPVNDAPVAEGESVVTVQNRPLEITLRGTDIDGDALTFAVAQPANGDVTLAGNVATYTPDAGFTGNDPFTFTASDGTATSAPATVSVTVVPAGGETTATIADVSVSESAGEATFTLSLSRPANGARIRVRTTDDSARSGSDYIAADATYTFLNGATSKDFTVKLENDLVDEDDERFRVNLTVEQGGVAAPDGLAFGTIADDDGAPALSIGNASISEGNAGAQAATLTVSLSAPSGKTVSVDYATADGTATDPGDYAATAGRLTFAPGDTTRTIPVAVHGDTGVELDETLTVQLSGATNAVISSAAGALTILNDDDVVPTPPPAPPAPTADLALTMTAPDATALDRVVTYNAVVTNNGPSAATGVKVTDALPAGLRFVSASVGEVACTGGATVVCPIGSLASGATAALTILATATEPGVHTNSATVSADQPDPAALNNTASATTRVPVAVVREPARKDGCTQRGTPGNDVLRGGPGIDILCGGGGNDVLIGFGGNDKLLGGPGNDRMLGGPGNDVLKGASGHDELRGGAGNDRLDGGRGRDRLAGDRGDDYVTGSYGDDVLAGGEGKDRLLGGPGKDRMRRDAQDVALGGPGGDRCIKAGVVTVCP